MLKTLYLNLDDDINKIVAKIKRQKTSDVVLVFPKKSFLFSDSINLRLLKKQLDMLGKKAAIVTMDERGQDYAREAGFELKYIPHKPVASRVSDIRLTPATSRQSPSGTKAAVAKSLPIAAAEPARKLVRRIKQAASSVVPPSAAVSAPVAVATVRERDNIFDDPEAVLAPSHRSYTAWIVSFVGACLLLALVLVLFVLPSADITIFAKSQTVARDLDITADVQAQSPDPAQLIIPAVAVNEQQNMTQTFDATGQKEIGSKAQGKVAIYNLTGQPLNLKAATTVLSVGSKNYLFLEDVNNIRPASGPTDDANATVVDVVAQAGGESYNVPAGTRMEITNQVFGTQPQRLFAKTSTAVAGGNSRFVSMVSDEDVKKAQDSMAAALVAQVREKLKEQDLTLVNEALQSAATDFTVDKPVGTETPTFAATGTIRVTGLAFDDAQLTEMVRSRLSSSLSATQQLQNANEDTKTFQIKNFDISSGIAVLSLRYESQALPIIDQEATRQRIVGKSQQEARDILFSQEEVERVDVALFPSWQKSIPLFKQKISITVQR